MDPLFDALLASIDQLRERYVSHITTGSVSDENSILKKLIEKIIARKSTIKEIANAVYGEEVE